jgi:hypothetical protein
MNSEDTLAVIGSPVKSLGEGKVGGYQVLFSSENDPDLSGDFFTKSTDYDVDWDDDAKTTVLYNHGMDPKLKLKKLGGSARAGMMKMDDIGVWVELQLDLRDEYEKAIYNLAKKGKLGWSSGTAAHLVEKEATEKATFIKRWPLGLDASFTPTPCEPRTQAQPVKSLPAETSFDELILDGLKAVYLGEYLEANLTLAALSRLNDALHYGVLYDCCFDEETSVADRKKKIEAALGEYSQIALRVFSVLMVNEDNDAAKALWKTLWVRPEEAPPAGATLEHELDSVLATVQSATERVKGYHATRQADGRDISPKRYEQLLAAKEGLDALIETVKPKASKEALADQLARAMEMVRLSAEADGLIPA